MRYVVLGDSLSEGIGDPLRDRTLRGWAALLGQALEADVVNLARRGATIPVVRRDQLQPAIAARPDLASVVVGVNDVFAGRPDTAGLRAIVEELAATGTTVLTARLHDPGRRLLLRGRLARRIREHVAELNDAADAIATDTGALVLDLSVADDHRGIWSLDRLHPNERGHRLIAQAALDALGSGAALPDVSGAGRRGHARWLATDGIPWFARLYAARIRERAR